MPRIEDLTIGQIKGLDIDAQLDAMSSIWASIVEKEGDLQVSDAEKRILDAALDNFDPAKTRSWTDLKSDLKSRVK